MVFSHTRDETGALNEKKNVLLPIERACQKSAARITSATSHVQCHGHTLHTTYARTLGTHTHSLSEFAAKIV
jgi:hypothetical protein